MERITTGLINSLLRNYILGTDIEYGDFNYSNADKILKFIKIRYAHLLQIINEGSGPTPNKSDVDIAIFSLAILLTEPLNEHQQNNEF